MTDSETGKQRDVVYADDVPGVSPMSDDDRNAYLASVTREREVYRAKGNVEGVRDCDEELERWGPSRVAPRGVGRRGAQSRGR